MKRAILVSSIVATALCTVSCRRTSPMAEAPTIYFDTVSVDTICPLLSGHAQPACHFRLSLERPLMKAETPLLPAVQQFVVGMVRHGAFAPMAGTDVARVVEIYCSQYIAKYLSDGKEAIEAYRGDVKTASPWLSYEELCTGRMLYNQEDVLSYQFQSYSFTGGAHGNTKVANGVFDYKTMCQLCVADLFASESVPDVSALLREELVRQYECQSMEELTKKRLFFAPDSIAINENFYVDDQGVTWMYDPYDIAPYSTGVVSVTLSWDSLLPYFIPESPLLPLAEKRSTGPLPSGEEM